MRVLKHHALNPNEIYEICKTPFRILKYSSLKDYHNIEDIFGKYKCVLLLYEDKINRGHWTCLIKQCKQICFYDSYGFIPDDELKFINLKFKRDNNMNIAFLTWLMLYSRLPIDYNDVQHQKLGEGIVTCGYWCAIRMKENKLNNEEFNKKYKNFTDNNIIEYCNNLIL